MFLANLSQDIADTLCASFNSDIFKYCCIVDKIPIQIFIEPMIAGAYACIATGKLDCAKDAVPVIVDKVMAGIVNQACALLNFACALEFSHL